VQTEILTPDKRLFSGKTRLVSVPGSKGAFEILKNHAPIISTLEKGTIRVVDEAGAEFTFDILKGVVECTSNQISILAEPAP